MTQTMHVVSHTHWDREWYRPFQIFRTRLVDVVDAVLDLLQRDPAYRYFHLDGQTIVLDDYLEIRPEKEQTLRQLIQAGRLLVGPWYTQPDEFLASGEAMVRNLLKGRRMAHGFGGCMELGYLPDSFGHTGQMPQIFAGFGFPAAVIFRGVTADQARSAFDWIGADGTRLLTINLPDDDAYSNYLYRLRGTLWDGGPIDFQRLDTELARLRSDTESMTVGNTLLWMDGVDHIYPNPKTPEIITYANQSLTGAHVIHSTLPAFVNQLMAESPQLQTVEGELRYANRAWVLQAVLANVASSHIRIKQANTRVQNDLERVVEPWCTLAWLHGADYPSGYLDLAWKYILQNHAHDSICGCSVDQVHREMHYRYGQAQQILSVVKERALDWLAERMDTTFAQEGATIATLSNSLPWSRDETCIAEVALPMQSATDVMVKDSLGQAVPHQVLAIKDIAPLRQPRHDIPSQDRRRIYRLAFNVDLASYSMTALSVKPSTIPHHAVCESLFVDAQTLQNKNVRVHVEPDATVTLTDLLTGKVYKGLFALEDRGDGGEGWNWVPPQFDQIYSSLGSRFEIAATQNGPILASMMICVHMRVPVGFTGAPSEHDPSVMHRSTELVDQEVEIELSLGAHARRLDARLNVMNNARNHRVRVLFPTDMQTEVCHADGAFDVVERAIRQPDTHDWREPQLGTFPHQSFVCVGDETGGLAVISQGTPEYEVIDGPRRTIAVTLLRAFGRGAGEPHEYLDSQELGQHSYSFSIYPFKGSWQSAGVVRESRNFNVPVTAVMTDRHNGGLKSAQSLLHLQGEGIDVTAVKRCEHRHSILVRFVNLSSEEQPVELGVSVQISAAYRLNLAEERQSAMETGSDGLIRLKAMPRQIITIEFVPVQ